MSRPRVTAAMLAAVAAGGAGGAVARWSLTEAFPAADGFPWTTFAVNVVGSGLLALLTVVVGPRRRLLALALGPGALGGFTTFSAYAEQTRTLLDEGSALLAAAYVAGTLLACLLAVHAVAAVVGRPPDPEIVA